MNFLDTYIKNFCYHAGIAEYGLLPELITVAASGQEYISAGEDIMVLANVFTSQGVLSGKIVSENKIITLNSVFQYQTVSKIKNFKGTISIKNNSSADTMYVEFVRIIPYRYFNKPAEGTVEYVKRTLIEVIRGINV